MIEILIGQAVKVVTAEEKIDCTIEEINTELRFIRISRIHRDSIELVNLDHVVRIVL